MFCNDRISTISPSVVLRDNNLTLLPIIHSFVSENALQIKTNVAKLATKCNRTWSSRILPGH